MRPFLVAMIAAGVALAAPVLAANPTLTAGGGGTPNLVESGRNVCWSEPADLNGFIAGSEVIRTLGLESEVANDFTLTPDATIILARWWGGYMNTNDCDDTHVAQTWNLRFYEDTGCVPGNVLAEYVVPDYAGETFIACQGGWYPIFMYEGAVSFPVAANTRYWFSAQAGDHTFPPQVGRLEAGTIIDCPSGFRSAYFSFPDWVFHDDVIWEEHDFSQEFECGETPTKDATWGAVKALYR